LNVSQTNRDATAPILRTYAVQNHFVLICLLLIVLYFKSKVAGSEYKNQCKK
jgi:hypothetical protein